MIPAKLVDPREDENSAFLVLEKNENKDIRQSKYFNKKIKNRHFFGISSNVLFENIKGEIHTIEYALEHAKQCFEITTPNCDSSTVSPLKNDMDLVKFAKSRLVQIVPNKFDTYKNILAFDSTISFG